ncbi:hypothetical protein DACRYDRAFT_22943 [Dacryopinax primogenitus]|uniref:Uncharacterized protein n=1 Tax=Dacryopinax primogenitus (strain DJM 731) TaxID=1858805 RepID=M5G5Y2_DACPD|nr:uncharacterized protein DACRYDRAFT_22943 [Dacryopinax primogenitus]EJU01197.1 hypothetical protein DACRYDRAFT_22943 [Dacryopinax primogenitus]
MATDSKILTPNPGASFHTGSVIAFTYNLVYDSGLYFTPTVDILLQKKGNDFAVEIANAITPDKSNFENGVLSYPINLASFVNADFVAGEYRLITIQHNTQSIAVHDGHLQTRQVTGDQELRLTYNLGPGPVQPGGPISLEPGPVIIQQDGSS